MKISILGSTGSIGTNTVEVINKHPEKFQVTGLCAGENICLLAEQILQLRPRLVCVKKSEDAAKLEKMIGSSVPTTVMYGSEGMKEVASMGEADIVVAAIAGSAGLLPTLAAVQSGKDVALANKETLVMAGELITREAKKNRCRIIPVDSEHSAVFQLLKGQSRNDLKSIILTASGGPFLNHTKSQLKNVTLEEALDHPRWKMGSKVTIDSASLMNKGLEIIEARWLFCIEPEKIKVVVHPQSIIHSMIEFLDGSVFAQMSEPDMKGPIAYALSAPRRLSNIVSPLDFAKLGKMTFHEPDIEKFPNLGLAYDALREGGLMPVVLNAANEAGVEMFLKRKIDFVSIPAVTHKVMSRFANIPNADLESIMQSDRWARQEAKRVMKKLTLLN